MPVIPVLTRLRQEDCKFKASLGSTVRSRQALVTITHKREKERKNKIIKQKGSERGS